MMESKYEGTIMSLTEWMSANASDEAKASRIPEEEWKWFDWSLYYPAQTSGGKFEEVLVRGYVYDPHNILKTNGENISDISGVHEFLCKDIWVLHRDKKRQHIKVGKFHGGSRFELVGLDDNDEELFFRLQWNP